MHISTKYSGSQQREVPQLALLQATLDAVKGHLAILDNRGVIIGVNRGWIDYAKINHLPHAEYGVGLNYLEICKPSADLHDPDAIKVSDGLDYVLSHPEPDRFIHEYLCPHPGDPRRSRWFSLSLTPFDFDGERYVLMAHEDVTEKHHLERTRKLLEAGIAQSRSGIMITNTLGTIEYVNEGFTHITGYAPIEVIGLNPRILKSGKISFETYLGLWSAISAGDNWKGQICNKKKDGSLYWEEMSVSPVRDSDGVITHFVAVKEDITLQRQQALLLKGVIDASSDAFFALDEHLRIVEFGHQAEAFLATPRESVLGTNFVQQFLTDETSRDAINTNFLDFPRDFFGKTERIKMRKGNGDLLSVEISMTSLIFQGEQRYCGFIRDITEILRKENLLLEAQKMESVGQMASGLAHDFNNHLHIIMGCLDLALMEPAEGEPFLQNARSAAKQGMALTRALSSFARKSVERIVPANVNELITELRPLVQQTVGKRTKLAIDLNEDIFPILIDVNAFNNALINLMVNARDAMEGPRSRVTIHTKSLELVNVESSKYDLPAGQYVVVSIEDNGVGMTQEVIDKALEPFFTTKPEGKGTGLGLSMVYGFCRQFGGSVHITSEQGRGTIVELVLPAMSMDDPSSQRMN